MFCNQCEQVAKGGACKISGACGKNPEVASLQDLLVYNLKGLSYYALEGRKVGVVDQEVNDFTIKALFSTLTNVSFDPERFETLVRKCLELRDNLAKKVTAAGGNISSVSEPARFLAAETLSELIKQGEKVVELMPDPTTDPDIQSLQDTLLYGLKGIAAYADHASILGQQDDIVYAFMHESLDAMTRKDLSLNN